MKKILLFISFISLLLVVLIISQLFKTVPESDINSGQNNNDSASATKLQPLAADVSIYDNETAAWAIVADETDLTNGSEVRTSATGRALVTRGSVIVTSINSNSEFTLSLSEDQKSNILKLVAGQTWTKITRALEQDEVYEVHTPTMVAAVRGTSFGVGAMPPQITVTEGTVWATAIDPETGLPDPSTTIVVPAGFTVVFENGQLVLREIVIDDKDPWFFEHNPEGVDTDELIEEKQEVVEELVDPVEEVEENTPPVPVVLPPATPRVTIDEVSPRTFDLTIDERLVIRGENLNTVDRVEIDGDDSEFFVTNVGVIVVDKAELPTREGEYDITLFYADASVSKRDAFVVVIPEPVGINISSVVAGVTNSQEDYVEVHGNGFLLVDSLLVNGKSNQFLSISDNLIQIFDFSIEAVETVELRGGGLTASYTM